jgi:hypothetical protein
MALDVAGLETALTAAFANNAEGKTPAQAAQEIAAAINAFVLTGTVTIVQAGLTVGPLLDSNALPCTTAAAITGTIV